MKDTGSHQNDIIESQQDEIRALTEVEGWWLQLGGILELTSEPEVHDEFGEVLGWMRQIERGDYRWTQKSNAEVVQSLRRQLDARIDMGEKAHKRALDEQFVWQVRAQRAEGQAEDWKARCLRWKSHFAAVCKQRNEYQARAEAAERKLKEVSDD